MKSVKWLAVIVLVIGVGIVTILSTGERKEIVVGAVLPLTGTNASFGGSVARGIGLALEEVNGVGGISGRRVRVEVEDSNGRPEVGVAAADRLITEVGVEVIIGGMASEVTLAISPLANERSIVLMSPASSASEISAAGDFVFRNYPSEGSLAAQAGRHALASGCARMAALTVDADSGRTLARAFRRAFSNGGGRVAFDERYSPGGIDLAAQVDRLCQARPDCAYISGPDSELRFVMEKVRARGLGTVVYSPVIFYEYESIATGRVKTDGIVFSVPSFDRASEEPHVQRFITAFQEKFGAEPDIWAAHGYDALQVIVEAMMTSGTRGAEIRDGLLNLSSYDGVAGETSFDSNGDVVRPAQFVAVRNGQFVAFEQ